MNNGQDVANATRPHVTRSTMEPIVRPDRIVITERQQPVLMTILSWRGPQAPTLRNIALTCKINDGHAVSAIRSLVRKGLVAEDVDRHNRRIYVKPKRAKKGQAKKEKTPTYDLRSCHIDDVRRLCEAHHGYASAGSVAVYAFAVYEDDRIVAAYAWQPPPPGAALAVCPEAPHGVLALSRMVAVPREERRLRHVSKPLRRQMLQLIDRTRWPVLVTYSDESLGHTGHVYKCSGWVATLSYKRRYYTNEKGQRASPYAGGAFNQRNVHPAGVTILQRWEHWACPKGAADQHIIAHGWIRVPIKGKRWRSGQPAYKYVRSTSDGSPRHPLYVRGDAPLVPYEPTS